jgi:hypothetical protein
VHPVALYIYIHIYIYIRIPFKYTWDRNWEFIGVTFFSLFITCFGPLRVIFRWNTITSLTYLEKAIDITTDPLFHNLSLIIHIILSLLSIIIILSLLSIIREIVKQRIRCNIYGFLKICKWCNCISPEGTETCCEQRE